MRIAGRWRDLQHGRIWQNECLNIGYAAKIGFAPKGINGVESILGGYITTSMNAPTRLLRLCNLLYNRA